MISKLVDDFVCMNQKGLVLELCKKYYDENVFMLSNGVVFAETMQEAHDKQKGFVEDIKHFDVKLVSKVVSEDISELVFHYKMTTMDSNVVEFTGKHVQKWKNNKIVKEEYQTL